MSYYLRNNSMTEDIFNIVDENDNVVGSAPRSYVHANKLRHRAAHVIIFCDNRKKILLQKRSMFKDSHPGIYTTSCSGHIDAGEDYDTGAIREMREETGVVVDVSRLTKVGKVVASGNTGNEFTFVYTWDCAEDEKFSPPPDEVESLDWVEVSDFERMIEENPKNFTNSFICVYKFYLSKRDK